MKSGLICYLCGKNEAESWDHVPPKTLFPKKGVEHLALTLDRMSNSRGYKLPTCKACNNLLNLDEEYIRDRFSIVGQNTIARQVFKEGTQPSYMRPYERSKTVSKLDLIRRDIVTVVTTSSDGLITRKVDGIKIDSDRVDRVAIKIVKGLYYQNCGDRILDEQVFQVYWDPPNWLPELLSKQSPTVGRFGEVLSYKNVAIKDDKSGGIWWLSFYKSLGIIVVVLNPQLAEEVAKES
ncbi:MAG: hypothetical protein GW947_02200 [Candidatus Pacebacteria bacterium]|nr:hypothetical protein [Candidatus Paceibacterota bacterium]